MRILSSSNPEGRERLSLILAIAITLIYSLIAVLGIYFSFYIFGVFPDISIPTIHTGCMVFLAIVCLVSAYKRLIPQAIAAVVIALCYHYAPQYAPWLIIPLIALSIWRFKDTRSHWHAALIHWRSLIAGLYMYGMGWILSHGPLGDLVFWIISPFRFFFEENLEQVTWVTGTLTSLIATAIFAAFLRWQCKRGLTVYQTCSFMVATPLLLLSLVFPFGESTPTALSPLSTGESTPSPASTSSSAIGKLAASASDESALNVESGNASDMNMPNVESGDTSDASTPKN